MQTFVKLPVLLLLGALVFGARAAEETAIVNEGKINVRGQPSLIGEVVTQLQRGEQVTVLEYVKNERAKGGEPTNWAKIKLPANTPVWVYAPMVKDGAVAATRLNLRAGAGDNYSVIGRLAKGDKITPIRTTGEWIEVEAPAGAYAFIDASLIKAPGGSAPTPAGPVVAAAPQPAKPAPPVLQTTTSSAISTPPPTAQPVQDELAAPTQPQPRAITEAPAISTPSAAPAQTAIPQELPKVAPAPVTASTRVEAAPGKRIVRREGIIRPTRSIQAPTWYELVSPQTKKTINYLHEEKMGINLKQLKGQKVIVSGEEAVDPRWPNTPILEMETVDVAP
jgi:hypothetical protein